VEQVTLDRQTVDELRELGKAFLEQFRERLTPAVKDEKDE
jgi:hypothetical protein